MSPALFQLVQTSGSPTTNPAAGTGANQTPVAQPGEPTAAERISQLEHQLKENDSQRTEVTSYINQLSIQVHRWKLRLQTLEERQAKLKEELAGISRES